MTRCNISEMCNEHGEIDDCDFAEWLDETQPDSYEKSLCRCEGCVGELEAPEHTQGTSGSSETNTTGWTARRYEMTHFHTKFADGSLQYDYIYYTRHHAQTTVRQQGMSGTKICRQDKCWDDVVIVGMPY